MKTENAVTVSGALHLIKVDASATGKPKKYLSFSVRQETPVADGSVRKDFLLRVRGDVRSSLGSGELYINALEIEKLA